MFYRHLRGLSVALAMATGGVLAGCSDDTSGPGGPPPPDLSTPRAAIRALADLYSLRQLAPALALHSPSFRFYPAQPESISFFAPGETSWDLARETEMLELLLVPERTTWLDQVLLEVDAQDIVDSTATLVRVSTVTELRYLLGSVLLESSRAYVEFIYEKNSKGDHILLAQRETTFPGSNLTYGQLKTQVQSPPSVATLVVEADSVDATSAVIRGRVNPNRLATTAHFEYGLDASYGSSTSAVDIGDDGAEHVIQERITGLAAATEYHYRVVAVSYWGTTRGIDLIFTTD